MLLEKQIEIMKVVLIYSKNIISKLNFYIICIFILTMPFNIDPGVIGGFSMTIFLFGLISYKRKIKKLFDIRHVQFLFLFILFSFSSYFWSETKDFSYTIDHFKYFFMILIGIYLSDLDKKKLEVLLYIFILSPIVYVVLNYTNALDITNIYSSHNEEYIKGYRFLMYDLRINIFIVLASLLLLIFSLNSFKQKNKKKAYLFFIGFIFYSTSMIIDDRTHSRMADVVLLIGAIYILLMYTKKEYYFKIILFFILLLIGIFNSMPKKVVHEYYSATDEILIAVKEKNYSTSLGYRWGMCKVGYNLIIEDPILGKGIQNIEKDIVRIKNGSEFRNMDQLIKSLHNEHIRLLVLLGIAGYGLFLLFVISFFKLNLVDKRIYLFKNVVLVVYLLFMAGEYYITNKTNGNTFILIVSLLTLYSYFEKEGDLKTLNNEAYSKGKS